ncbi:MAG TPA: hypothetical protein VMH50_17580 [Thermoleophilia bacterium]|nr:hypothetical protein [Thermoleophilia bacterium]
MKRMKVLIGKRRVMVIATLAILVLAAVALVASSASFTSTSANVGNVFTAGNLTHSNTSTLLAVTGLKPDDKWINEGTVTLTNGGSLAGVFTMTSSNLTHADGPNHGDISTVLNLRIHRASDAAGVYIYNGKINAIGSVAAGTIAGSGSETYTFEVQFPDGGKPASATGGDNAYKLSSMSIDFNWEAVTN